MKDESNSVVPYIWLAIGFIIAILVASCAERQPFVEPIKPDAEAKCYKFKAGDEIHQLCLYAEGIVCVTKGGSISCFQMIPVDNKYPG